MDAHLPSHHELLSQGPQLQLPPPSERRELRELWGAKLEEVAKALKVDPATMSAWEAGQHTADAAGTYSYLRLLNAFRDQLPTGHEPDWAALRTTPTPPAPAAAIPAQATAEHTAAKPARRGASWTQDEKDYLRAAFRDGTAVPELAVSLGRSERSVRWTLYHLRLIPFPADDVPDPRPKAEKPKAYTVEDKRKTHPNAYAPWSTEDDKLLAERCAQGVPLDGLSREFGRNKGGIAARLKKINAVGPAAKEAREYGEDDHDVAL
ncbi:helix-turn-helix domain-containing protein [Streptomyces griseofuscus]|uniref:helix-turn-helix domain-containing protein n=1 Tax=Streptomyces griseofuscus TaxID=146922 RepID=UPI00381032CA